VRQKTIPPFVGEDYERHWGCFSFRGKVVLDIGADYGSTASFFMKKGARKVIAVESDPSLFAKLVSNFRGSNRVIPVKLEIASPQHFEQLISRYKPEIVKMDCEGCENYLATVNPVILRRVNEYIIETHKHVGLNTAPLLQTLFDRLHYTYQMLKVETGQTEMAYVEVIHAKKAWPSYNVSEYDVVRWKNALSRLEKADILIKKLKLDPVSLLLYFYAYREDLQRAFPEVGKGDYVHLIEWANDVIRKRVDEHSQLRPYAEWYRNGIITSDANLKAAAWERDELYSTLVKTLAEMDGIKTSFGYKVMRGYAERLDKHLPDGKTEQVSSFQNELLEFQRRLRLIASERDELYSTLAKTLAERDELYSTLVKTLAEMDGIKTSFGYKVMRGYAERLDKHLPNGTRRGELRKVIVRGFRIAANEGIVRLLHRIGRKVRRKVRKALRGKGGV
jgi:hypothetical protein